MHIDHQPAVNGNGVHKNNKKKGKKDPNLNLLNVIPKTESQKKVFEYFHKNKNIFLHGLAGTGKTFLCLYLALSSLFDKRNLYEQLIIVRSVVPSRDMGFLPGNIKEKSRIYESPYYLICSELFGRADAYDILKNKKTIDFATTSFMRGITFRNSIILIDEVQNMSDTEILTTITRIGYNCRLLVSGDFRQSDFERDKDRVGIHRLFKTIEQMESFGMVEFNLNDICRSELVKEYLQAREWAGL